MLLLSPSPPTCTKLIGLAQLCEQKMKALAEAWVQQELFLVLLSVLCATQGFCVKMYGYSVRCGMPITSPCRPPAPRHPPPPSSSCSRPCLGISAPCLLTCNKIQFSAFSSSRTRFSRSATDCIICLLFSFNLETIAVIAIKIIMTQKNINAKSALVGS